MRYEVVKYRAYFGVLEMATRLPITLYTDIGLTLTNKYASRVIK